MPEATMTNREREDLQRLVRQREKVLKSAAAERSAQLLADFENQMGAQYAFDDDAIWAEAKKAAEREVNKAQKIVAARCRELGIPEQFAPSLGLYWNHRGYDNSIDKRKKELRVMAKSQIDALERQAVLQIEVGSVEAQTALAVAGLSSAAARAFVEKLPSVETLMPLLSFAEFAGEADPPIAQQLVTPNALRQRRFRERQALRNASGNGADPLRAISEKLSAAAQSIAEEAEAESRGNA
jgi:hypothetical protein